MTEHPKRLTMLHVDEAKPPVDVIVKSQTAPATSEAKNFDEIEDRIDVFLSGVLEVPPRYRRAEHVIERLVETRSMNEIDELRNIASRLRINLAFVPHAQLEVNQDEE